MSTRIRLLTLLACLLLCGSVPAAQTPQREGQSTAASSREVTIIIQQQQVRFTTPQPTQELRLQIFNQSGQMIYDRGAAAASELTWDLLDASGEAVKSGLYDWTLTMKEQNAETPGVRRGHLIVDRGQDREAGVDRLWITSHGADGIGTEVTSGELTVARTNENTIAGTRTSAGGAATSDNGSDSSAGPGNNGKTHKSKKGKGVGPAAIDPGSTGTEHTIAKWMANDLLGNSGITEKHGRVGINTTAPEAGLHVFASSGGSLAGLSIDRMIVPPFDFGPQGYGFQIRSIFADPLTPPVTRTDFLVDAGGRVGIGTPNPLVNLDVVGTGSTEASVHGVGGQAVLSLNSEIGGTGQIWTLESGLFAQPGLFGIFDRNAGRARLAINTNGNVGMGTATPLVNLDVVGSGLTEASVHSRGGQAVLSLNSEIGAKPQVWTLESGLFAQAGLFGIYDRTADKARLAINTNGSVGIGTTTPLVNLDVVGSGLTEASVHSRGGQAVLSLNSEIAGTNQVWTLESGLFAQPGLFGIFDRTNNRARLTIDNNTGVTGVDVLRINGADFSENFDVGGAKEPKGEAASGEVAPGMVVSIDPASPGRLAVSSRAYDRRVAGIISGAGGVRAGIMMGQEGTLADGKHPVALSGRAYCWVDASHGAIKPGDLLTTSATPGHAMKVTDSRKAQGAIIGKAMTGLKSGQGLVLVLVTLQ